MKKFLLLILVILIIFSTTGCNDEEAGGEKGNIIGENVFQVKVMVRNMTSENVKFMVRPHADEAGYEGQGEVDGPGGVFGTYGAVPGTKKGDKADLEGSFTLYAHDTSGPSATIDVKGTYVIQDLKSDFSTMHFYIYEGGSFTKSDKETVYK
ncbi:MAG: hypothetical protein VR72_09230 [Clostridiaceae bacterium BRH_c20a]|nr:MAG: hypothetical protein VR72_09230 [Clostridiaceae bacterium BRH_c20a]